MIKRILEIFTTTAKTFQTTYNKKINKSYQIIQTMQMRLFTISKIIKILKKALQIKT